VVHVTDLWSITNIANSFKKQHRPPYFRSLSPPQTFSKLVSKIDIDRDLIASIYNIIIKVQGETKKAALVKSDDILGYRVAKPDMKLERSA
jgi:hypothetical protein